MTHWRATMLSLLLALPVLASAAELRWPGRSFQMVANEKRLPDFLRELVASQGTTVVIDPKVEGVISGRFAIGTGGGDAARKVLDDICANYGLTWYFDGSMLFIELASDARDELITINADSAQRIQAVLQRMRIGDKRFPLQVSQAEGQVFVSGPRRYVEAVRQVIRSVDTRASQRDRSEVRLYPLKYAWAADFEIKRASGRGTLVPGVVSVLRSLFDPGSGGGRGGMSSNSGGSAVAMSRASGSRSARQISGPAGVTPRIEVPGGLGVDDGDAQSPSPVSSRNDLPQFQVDSRMNAVLIRDVPERMAEYTRLIESMDTRPRLVEIEVTIMDISNDSLDRLGVDWRAHGSRVDFQTGNGAAPALTWNGVATAAGQTGATAPVGALFTAAIGSEMRDFLLARVSALASKGEANFVARPKVLTLDNTEASLENKSEFFVRVQGFQDSSLYTVVAGTDVRVTPLIIDDASGRGVMLNINIGDDSLSADMVDNLPIVRRRSVVTQALVSEGKSVLLAGYSSEERVNGSSGVPVLSSIPLLGNLFKYSEKKRNSVERFYMLTPRFVAPDPVAGTGVKLVPGEATPPAASPPASAPGPEGAAAPARRSLRYNQRARP